MRDVEHQDIDVMIPADFSAILVAYRAAPPFNESANLRFVTRLV
jgi:hypothetical protein